MNELEYRMKHIAYVKETGQFMVDNADKIDFMMCYCGGAYNTEEGIMLKYIRYQGAYESVIGAVEIIKRDVLNEYDEGGSEKISGELE